jgi:hypothetical protein
MKINKFFPFTTYNNHLVYVRPWEIVTSPSFLIAAAISAGNNKIIVLKKNLQIFMSVYGDIINFIFFILIFLTVILTAKGLLESRLILNVLILTFSTIHYLGSDSVYKKIPFLSSGLSIITISINLLLFEVWCNFGLIFVMVTLLILIEILEIKLKKFQHFFIINLSLIGFAISNLLPLSTVVCLLFTFKILIQILYNEKPEYTLSYHLKIIEHVLKVDKLWQSFAKVTYSNIEGFARKKTQKRVLLLLD